MHRCVLHKTIRPKAPLSLLVYIGTFRPPPLPSARPRSPLYPRLHLHRRRQWHLPRAAIRLCSQQRSTPSPRNRTKENKTQWELFSFFHFFFLLLFAETFAQELDLERKARQQQSAQQNQQQSQHSDRDIKSPVPGMCIYLCLSYTYTYANSTVNWTKLKRILPNGSVRATILWSTQISKCSNVFT